MNDMPRILRLRTIDGELWAQLPNDSVGGKSPSPVTLYTDLELDHFKAIIKESIRQDINEMLSE
jgi:hypothetical protein